MDIRRSLLPRDEFLHAMDGFMSTLERPVMAILYICAFLNGDLGNIYARPLIDILFQDFGE